MFNRYKFEDIFGFEFGAKRKVSVTPDPQNNEFEIEFRTPNHSEENVKFLLDTMAFIYFRRLIKMEVWEGEEMVFARKVNDAQIPMFVNLDGIDRLADDPSGHPGIDNDTVRLWLKPNTVYVLKVYRTTGPSANNPISVGYYGTDDNQVDYGPDISDSVDVTIGGVKGVWIPNASG